MKGYPAPLTWERILELAAQGHDHYDAALTSDRARQLVASVRQHFAGELQRAEAERCNAVIDWHDTQRLLAAANATLERVRDLADSTSSDGNTWVYLRDLRAAIDGQPEALKVCTECEAPIGPGRHFCQPEDFHQTVRDALARELVAAKATLERVRAEVDKWSGSGCEDGDTPAFCAMVGIAAALARPGFEAPKGQEAEHCGATYLRECASNFAPEARVLGNMTASAIVTVCDDLSRAHTRIVDLERDLAAANARIAELETQHDADIDAIARAVRHEDAANARADAAERLNEKLCEDLHVIARDRHEAQRGFDNALKVLAKDDECVARLQQNYAVCAEARDLLKAERDQLAAANARLEQAIERWKVAFAEACTPEERKVLESAGEIRQWVLEDWAYQPHGAQSFARAELANRAAKALKPPAEPSDRS
jgi:hypothetical protein